MSFGTHQISGSNQTDSRILLQLLGAQDALFIPPRYPKSDKWPAWWVMRREYTRRGTTWRSRAQGEMERKRAERALAEIVSQGFVRTTRSAARVTSVALTFKGDQHARALADCPLGVMPFLREVLQNELMAYTNHPDSSFEGGPTPWIPETIILGEGKPRGWGDGHHKELKIVEALLVSPMVHQLVECNSDVHGRTWYRLTQRGLAVAKGDMQLPTVATLPAPVPDGHDIYWNALCDAVAMIKPIDGGHTRDIGECPLTASLETKRSARRRPKRSAI